MDRLLIIIVIMSLAINLLQFSRAHKPQIFYVNRLFDGR